MCYSYHYDISPYDFLKKHPKVNEYMNGTFNLRLPKPKLSFVGDVDNLFRCFDQQGNNFL